MTRDPQREQLLKPHIRYLKEVVPLEKQEQTNMCGESLPAGIVLHTAGKSKGLSKN